MLVARRKVKLGEVARLLLWSLTDGLRERIRHLVCRLLRLLGLLLWNVEVPEVVHVLFRWLFFLWNAKIIRPVVASRTLLLHWKRVAHRVADRVRREALAAMIAQPWLGVIRLRLLHLANRLVIVLVILLVKRLILLLVEGVVWVLVVVVIVVVIVVVLVVVVVGLLLVIIIVVRVVLLILIIVAVVLVVIVVIVIILVLLVVLLVVVVFALCWVVLLVLVVLSMRLLVMGLLVWACVGACRLLPC